MKRIYFVRHGITEGNESNTYQLLETPLSEKGKKQASFLAERFSKLPFEVLITSTMERAQETARVIAERTESKIVLEELFHEILKPSVVRGKKWNDPKVVEVMEVVDTHWEHPTSRHSDEENFHDLKQRAIQALNYLISRPEETMVVVTHGTILKMMLSVMMEGENTTPEFFARIEEFFFPQNTGITWCEYDNAYHPNRWQCIIWNDHAHLAD